ncbi:hypothetical protein COLSTE_01239 [Collinsella stercoris DSM 13279]|uniref:Uncharacterized protein n=1 Tax=Collinsella stercoris DSM 13279 TaxID=445975 RepID=B6GAY8_9ACTN|nr:hypothetical protein COLSTE_01239 [Collinsella stercoris DSM 13279]
MTTRVRREAVGRVRPAHMKLSPRSPFRAELQSAVRSTMRAMTIDAEQRVMRAKHQVM